ncbi:hypothetical protein ACQ4PT_070829 [Festuca glaucescens]
MGKKSSGRPILGALVRFLAPEGGGRGGGPAGRFGRAWEGPGRHHDGRLEEDDLAGAGDDVRLKQGDLRATCGWSRGCGAGGAGAALSPSREHAAPPAVCSGRDARSLSSTSQNRPGEPVTCAASRRVDGLEALIRDKDAPMAQSGSPPPFPTTEMRKKQKQEDEQEQQPLGSLPEGPLVEILSRVPYRSLCRFECVSKPWLALCSDPQVRKRCPQTLTGFFHRRPYGRRGVNFRNLSGRGPPMVDPSLPFLRKSYERVNLEHCCGGLILGRCWKSVHPGNNGYNLVVCNPATEKWTELPPCPVELPDKMNSIWVSTQPSPPVSWYSCTFLTRHK